MNKGSTREQMQELGRRARAAYGVLASASAEEKNASLFAAAKALRERSEMIMAANADDLIRGQEAGLNDAMIDRLTLDEARIKAMAKGLEDIAIFPEPVGRVLAAWERPNGLKFERISVPLGVIGIIYESRPNVTADAGALCIKSGNAAILRAGSDSFDTSRAIAECIQIGLQEARLPEDSVQLVPTRDRAAVGAMLTMSEFIDVIIPRGGKSLTRRIVEESRIPTIQHLDGNCHTYIHQSADPTMAKEILINAKFRRTGICGATESVLIDDAVARKLLPELLEALFSAGCEIRGDDSARSIDSRVILATEDDWSEEYLDAIVSVRTVPDIGHAIDHINRYGSHHTDAIIAQDNLAAEQFLAGVDSAIVLRNASTQFADGGEFGMGAEIGISTGRLHARGPVGVEQLTTYKYIIRGDGQVRT